MFDILNLIQVACLHLEEFVDRDAGTDGSNDDSKRKLHHPLWQVPAIPSP